jgi:hypothetical protein
MLWNHGASAATLPLRSSAPPASTVAINAPFR